MANKDYLVSLSELRDKVQSTVDERVREDERVLEELDEIIRGLAAESASKGSSQSAVKKALEQYGLLLIKLVPEIVKLINNLK